MSDKEFLRAVGNEWYEKYSKIIEDKGYHLLTAIVQDTELFDNRGKAIQQTPHITAYIEIDDVIPESTETSTKGIIPNEFEFREQKIPFRVEYMKEIRPFIARENCV